MKLKPITENQIIIKSPAELRMMRESGLVVSRTVRELVAAMKPGMTTKDLDQVALKSFKRQGAKSTAFGYHGFPGQICVSVNNQVVHGIPGPLKIHDGDLVKFDVAAQYRGYVGDTTLSAVVGSKPNDDQQRIMAITYGGLMAGIAAAKAGNRLSDIGHAIQTFVEKRGLKVVQEFVGHGVGRSMHEPPQVSHWGAPGKGPLLRPGMVIAIEPQVNLGGRAVQMLSDGWTAVTLDGKISAHYEHTVAITPDGPWVLTEPDDADVTNEERLIRELATRI
ncbi:MAG: type I methionyl aminopeptidase [Chloroflexi bacterium]|nr:type I methionyl aminopeptidase [Chloroflexota bacterium]